MTRSRILFPLLLAAALRVVAQPAGPLPANDQRRLADGLYARGLHALALAEYTKLLEGDPAPDAEDVLAFRAGESAHQIGDAVTALRFFERAIRVGDRSDAALRARLRLAGLLLRADQPAAAREQAEALVAAKPAAELDAPARYLLGQILQREQKEEEAGLVFAGVLKDYPDDDLAVYAALALARAPNRDPALRRGYFERALRNPPSADVEVEALWGLATLESEARARDKAAALFWRLWKTHPDSSRVRAGALHIAWAQLQAGKYARALDVSAQTPDPRKKDSPDTWLYLEAVSQREEGRIEDARRAYAALLRDFADSPFRAAAAYEWAVLLVRQGEHDAVLPLAEDLLRVPERRGEGLWLLAESARAAKQLPLAFQYYTDLSRLPEPNPRAADARYFRAILLQEKDPRAAVEALRDFARLHPEDSRAAAALVAAGGLRLAAEDPAGALELWDLVLRDYPKDPRSVDILFEAAMLEIRLQRNPAALARLKTYVAIDPPPPQRPQAFYWLGILLDQAGASDEAEPWLTQAVAAKLPAEQDARARLRLGILLQRGQREAEALTVLRPLLAESGERAPADALLVWMLAQAQAHGEGEILRETATAMTAATRQAATREIGWYALARQAQALDHAEEAIAAYRQGLLLGSQTVDAAEASNHLGRLLIASKTYAEAEERLSAAARLASQLERGDLQAKSLRALGDLYAAQGQWEEAARLFMSVAVLYDDPLLGPDCLRSAAEAYEKAGQPAQAAQARQELRKRYPAPPEAPDAIQQP